MLLRKVLSTSSPRPTCLARAPAAAVTHTGTCKRTAAKNMASAEGDKHGAAALPLARVRLLAASEAEPIVWIQLEAGGKLCTFNRPAHAPLEATLRRIQLSLSDKKKSKKAKKPKDASPAQADTGRNPADDHTLVARLLCGGDGLAHGLSNAEAWRSGTILELQGVGAWRVEAGLPHVVSLRVPGAERAMVGFVLRPTVILENADAAAECQWRWRRARHLPGNQEEPAEELVLSERQEYTPDESDIGHALSVRCVPTRDGTLFQDSLPAEVVTARVASSDIEGATAGIDIVELRSAWTAAGCSCSVAECSRCSMIM